MFKGVVFALGACLVWGLIFVVPGFMAEFSSIEIALGRYSFYGLISLIFFLKGRFQNKFHYSRVIWFKAFYFSLSTVGYYTALVFSLRYASPAIAALILGVSPITIAFYGNWKRKEIPFKSLFTPSILTIIGLIVINIPHFQQTASPTSYLLGIGCALISLTSWSWYVVANANFLRYHSDVSSSDWSTLMGVSMLFWVFLITTFLTLFCEPQIQWSTFQTLNDQSLRFFGGSAVLGLLCSWIGVFLWNRASLYLPTPLAGQLTVFETIFGVIFVYLLAKTLPSSLELVGMIILFIAVVYCIRKFAKNKSYNKQISPH
jgi:drug/metabolite transporter (DMT)-like permease